MSSTSDRRRRERVARHSSGFETAGQPGRSLASVITHPEQLIGPRARTRIRPGATMTRRSPMETTPCVIGIDVSKHELVIAVHPSEEQWISPGEPDALDRLVTRLQTRAPHLLVLEAR